MGRVAAWAAALGNLLLAFALALVGVGATLGGHPWAGLAALAVALALLVLVARAAAGAPARAPPPRRVREVPLLPDPPRDALEDLPWPATACPACGFLDVRLH